MQSKQESHSSLLNAGYTIKLLQPDSTAADIKLYVVYLSLKGTEIMATYFNDQLEIKSLGINYLLRRSGVKLYSPYIQQNSLPTTNPSLMLAAIRSHTTPGFTLMPCFNEEQYLDEEIAEKVLNVYRTSRHILMDASLLVQCLQYMGTDHIHNPHTIDMIATLFYLEHFLLESGIQEEYLQPEVIHKLNICRKKGIQLSQLDMYALFAIITYYQDHEAHEQRISISLLNEIQPLIETYLLSMETDPSSMETVLSSIGIDLRQVISDAFTRPVSPEQRIYNMWSNGQEAISVHASCSMFGFKDHPSPLQHSVQTSHSIQMHDL